MINKPRICYRMARKRNSKNKTEVKTNLLLASPKYGPVLDGSNKVIVKVRSRPVF